MAGVGQPSPEDSRTCPRSAALRSNLAGGALPPERPGGKPANWGADHLNGQVGNSNGVLVAMLQLSVGARAGGA